MKPKEILLLSILAALQFTNIMDFMIVMPLGPQLMRVMDITPSQFSWIVSAYTFSAGVSGFLGAFWIDRLDRKKALLYIYAGFILGTMACGMANSYLLLSVARVITGIFGGILGAIVLSIVADAFPMERRGTAMGIVMAAFSIASIAGVPFGLFLATRFGWASPFWFLTGISFIIFIAAIVGVPRLNSHMHNNNSSDSKFKQVGSMIINKEVRKAMLFMFLLILGQFSIIPFISPYMVKNVGFTETQLSLIYFLGGLVTIISGPLAGRLSDRVGKKMVFYWAGTLTIIPLFLITHVGGWGLIAALISTTLFFIFVNGRMIPAMALMTGTVSPNQRGAFMSINTCVQQLAAGFGSVVAGKIIIEGADHKMHNYNIVGYIAIAASILAVFLVSRISIKEAENIKA